MNPNVDRWLLPAGVEEVLPERAELLEALRRELLDLYSSWGYRLVIPPFVEYLESLLTGTGRDLDLQTFKLIDQLTGRLMGLRADMTPQVARIDSRHGRSEGPVRLCYIGTVLHTLPDGFSGSRSPVQVGAELYGHGGIESDCEVLCLMLETLARARVRNVHLDLGHVGIFRGLAHAAGLEGPAESELHGALQRKARGEIETLVAELGDPAAARRIAALADLNGDGEVLGRARVALEGAGAPVHAALDDLERLAAALSERVRDVTLHFDLAELSGYAYHTGVVFAAFVAGQGQEIARGGRYDDIGRVFGRARPATGFSTDLKTLAVLGEPVAEIGRRAIAAPWSTAAALLERVRTLRADGERVVWALPGQVLPAPESECDRELREIDGRWTVVERQPGGAA